MSETINNRGLTHIFGENARLLSGVPLPEGKLDLAAVNQVHEGARTLDRTLHNQTVSDADTGYRKTNAKSENHSSSSAKDKAASDAQKRNLPIWLHQYINGLNEDLGEINEALQALDDLRDLYEKGELDYENEDHQRLMKKAGLTREDIEKNGPDAFDSREQKLENQKMDKEIQIQNASELNNQIQQNPDDPAVLQKIMELEQSQDGAAQIDKLMSEITSTEKALNIDRELGYEEIDLQDIQSVTAKSDEDQDSFFDHEPVSAAAKFDGEAFKTVDVGTAFAQAADPDPQKEAATPVIKTELGSKLSFNSDMG